MIAGQNAGVPGLWLAVAFLVGLPDGLTGRAGEAGDFTVVRPQGPFRVPFHFRFEFARAQGPSGVDDNMPLREIIVFWPGRKQILTAKYSEMEFDRSNLRQNIRFVDLNDDGYDDLLVPVFRGATGNCGYFVWTYLPRPQKFVFNEELSSDLECNPEPMGNGLVTTSANGGGGRRIFNTYRWDGRRYEQIVAGKWEPVGEEFYEIIRRKVKGRWKRPEYSLLEKG